MLKLSPHCPEQPPQDSRYFPTVLKLSITSTAVIPPPVLKVSLHSTDVVPTVLMFSPTVLKLAPGHCTEQPPQY